MTLILKISGIREENLLKIRQVRHTFTKACSDMLSDHYSVSRKHKIRDILNEMVWKIY